MAKKYNKTNQNKTPKVTSANDQLGENMTEFAKDMNPNNSKKNNPQNPSSSKSSSNS